MGRNKIDFSNIAEKKCSCCKEIKNITFFRKDKSQSSGYCCYCEICVKLKKKYWQKNHKNRRPWIGQPVRRLKIKTQVLTHYGNNRLACVLCGFSDIRALSIDHIAGNGVEHRKQIANGIKIKSGGQMMYSWLIRQNYPTGYQTLCMNCQWIKRDTNKECRNGCRKWVFDKDLI